MNIRDTNTPAPERSRLIARKFMSLLLFSSCILFAVLGCLSASGIEDPQISDFFATASVENFTAAEYDSHYVLRSYEGGIVPEAISPYFPVTVVIDGIGTSYLCKEKTVGDFLTRINCTLGTDDSLAPSLNSLLSCGDIIRIARTIVRTETEYEAIPYETTYIDDAYMRKGATSVVTAGTDGQKEFVYTVTYKNGEEVSRELISQKTVSSPKKAVVKRGTGEGGYLKLSDGTVLKYRKRLRLEATAYNSANTPNITAVGTIPKRGTVAIDRRVIPLGTNVYVTSISGKWAYGKGLCEDTGVIGQRIDLYMDSLEECYDFGRRDVYVYILDD